MELHSNTHAYFTKWVVGAALLKTPFVLVDVGVQGGENERWEPLGDHLVLHGFDAIEEVIVALARDKAGHANRHYHALAIGSFDGEQTLYFDADDPFASSFYQKAAAPLRDGPVIVQPRQVQVRRLDSLIADGIVPPPDFIKVDVEGYEKAVFLGAEEALRGALGFEAETAFTVSVEYPATHFGALLDIALKNHQRLFDIDFNRVPRATFQRALMREHGRSIEDHASVGRPAAVNVLFCRDLIEEVESPSNYPTPPPPVASDQVLKQAIVYELHGLNDVAIDTIERFADRIDPAIDIEKAVRLLADPLCHTSGPMMQRVYGLQKQVEQINATHAEAMAESKRVLEAERAGSAARIQQLQDQVEQVGRTHVDAMREAQRVLAGETESFTARIRKLDEDYQQYQQAHANSMTDAEHLLAAEKAAAVARIRELEKEVETCRHAYAELGRLVASHTPAPARSPQWRLAPPIAQLRSLPMRAARRLRRMLSALKGRAQR